MNQHYHILKGILKPGLNLVSYNANLPKITKFMIRNSKTILTMIPLPENQNMTV